MINLIIIKANHRGDLKFINLALNALYVTFYISILESVLFIAIKLSDSNDFEKFFNEVTLKDYLIILHNIHMWANYVSSLPKSHNPGFKNNCT